MNEFISKDKIERWTTKAIVERLDDWEFLDKHLDEFEPEFMSWSRERQFGFCLSFFESLSLLLVEWGIAETYMASVIIQLKSKNRVVPWTSASSESKEVRRILRQWHSSTPPSAMIIPRKTDLFFFDFESYTVPMRISFPPSVAGNARAKYKCFAGREDLNQGYHERVRTVNLEYYPLNLIYKA